MSPEDSDVARKDLKFATTGMLLTIAVALAFAILS